jgi:serine/threonine-protein kinase
MPTNVSWGSKNLFDKPVSPPSETNPDVNQALDSIVMKTMEKQADSRYPTAKELLSALENWKPTTHESAHKTKTLSSEPSKVVLGMPSPADEGIAKDLAQKAFKARQTGRLAEAADLMEEAFNKSPELRQKYAHQVKLWRCGISM